MRGRPQGAGAWLSWRSASYDTDVRIGRGSTDRAEQGAGNFYFLEGPSAATEVFTEELDFFMQPLALDVQVSAAAGPGYQFGEVVGSHLWSAGDRTGSIQIPAVFVASRTSQSGEPGRRQRQHDLPRADADRRQHRPGRRRDAVVPHAGLGGADLPDRDARLAADPEITPEQPYLSAPEMAERYAMYNMFLGLRAATRSTDPGCAMAVLDATRAGATAWNVSHEDPLIGSLFNNYRIDALLAQGA